MKKLLATLLLGAALAAAALPVSAQEADSTVTVTANGNAAAVSLNLPKDMVQGVKAFQLSFEVDGEESVDASFAFDKSLPGTVQEYRYDASTGRLNVYVAGRDDVLPGGSTSLGQVRLTGGTGTATVSVVADSLQLVNGAQGKTEIEATSNGEVSLDLNDKATPAPQNTAKPSAPSEQAGQDTENTSESQNSNSGQEAADNASSMPSAVPVVTPSAGQSSAAPNGSGNKKPSAGSNASSGSGEVLSAEATPEPETTAQATATPKPSATPENAVNVAGEETSSGLPLMPILVIVGLAVVVAVVVLVIRRRR